ncbi:5'-nucleotidase domain-containing protein 1 [Lucilia cuprina]|uniref:5'-nucleotidase domain-containing protein 1 n=1 Tax=Lucilia cuprina TaxID=7375 RepID=UPI001F0586C6|nr:5'-nucleotidase domain-containing protein 1 [Lucilia cuprina]
MFSLNVRCVQNSAKLDKILLFTLGKLRNYVSVTAAQRIINITTAVSTNINNTQSNKSKRGAILEIKQLTRYYSSADTKMKNFKEFHLMDYDIIGFDLDGTLLRYDLNNMVPLEHKLLREFLVKEKNYPKELLEQKFDSQFIQKGLIIDSDRGNILKLSSDGTILKAAHGTRFLNDKEICKVYGEARKWDVAQQYIKDPLAAWNGPLADKLRTLLDYFDIAASLVFAQTVDVLDRMVPNNKLTKNDYKIWPDMLSGLIQIYSREHFATGASAYFEALKGNPEKYLLKTDRKVIDLLKQLKASGKALYLLTGSNIDFANFTASYALGPQWRDLFDCTIGFAKKPGFFFAQRPFLQIANLNELEGSELSLSEHLKPNSCYSQGNWQQLKESLCKQVLNRDPQEVRSLYVGDNLIQDVYTPKAKASIDTLALSEELLEYDENYEFKTIVQSPLWGSYYCINATPTLWSSIIAKYSQLCVSHMDVMTDVPLEEKINCTNKEGYFPQQPEGLLEN